MFTKVYLYLTYYILSIHVHVLFTCIILMTGMVMWKRQRIKALCVSGVGIENSCNNISAQNQANTGNSALGQQGGSGDNKGDGENSADQDISQGQSSDQKSQCVSGGGRNCFLR